MGRSSLRWIAAAAACACGSSLIGSSAAVAHDGSRSGNGVTAQQRAVAARTQARNGVDPGPTPRAKCGPGSHPETGMQGRVSAEDTTSGRAAEGYTCNAELVSHFGGPGGRGASGGYKVERYVDAAGRECAYFDSTLLFPLNASNPGQFPTGTIVLDMSNPSHPVRTTTLVTPAMQTPHESMVLNPARGLVAAVMGNPTAYPGIIDVYDATADCRRPELRSISPAGILGHESGFAPDGRTFYAASIGTGHLIAVDVSNPSLPQTLWIGQYNSHGLSISNDGNRAYVAARQGLIILDVSEVNRRLPNPQVREVSRLRWDNITIPQNAIPVTINGHSYVVEIDEFATDGEGNITGNGGVVGAARIIDIADETSPRVVSNIRLEVHEPENRSTLAGDPGAGSIVGGYAGHYCNVPRREEPGIVACSFILSGLRVFDIRDPFQPKEIAYFNTPKEATFPGDPPSSYAMSSPTFAPERGEIWYSDGNSGFYSIRLTNGVWPFAPKAARPRPPR
jgi:LVIVD repeat